MKYVINRVLNMDYKKMLNMVKVVSKKTHKNKMLVFFDIVFCGLKYQCGYIDYNLFEMYNLNCKERRTIMTRGKNNALIKYFNNPNFNHLFLNKNEFNRKFDKYLKRDWLIIDDNNYADFLKLIKGKKYVMAKPVSGICGRGIQKVELKCWDNKELFNYLLENKLNLIEELIVQNKELNKLHPCSINTVRMITLSKNNKSTIVAAYLRIGNGKVVDNFNSGGMVAPIDIKTGIIHYPALDKKGNLYNTHPLTNINIVDFKIPLWDDIISFGKTLAPIIKEVGMVGWDIAISDKGPVIVEGNEFPGHDIYQLPPHRTNNIGMVIEFERALNELGIDKKGVFK